METGVYPLVVEYRVRAPDAIVRYPYNPNPCEFGSVPLQVVIGPDLGDPAVRRQNLVLFILKGNF